MNEKMFGVYEKETGEVHQIANTSKFFLKFGAIASLAVLILLIISAIESSAAISSLIFMGIISTLALLLWKFKKTFIAVGLFLISLFFLLSVGYIFVAQIISSAKYGGLIGVLLSITGIGNVLLVVLAISLFVSSISSMNATSEFEKSRDAEVKEAKDEHGLLKEKFGKYWFVLGFQTIAVLILIIIQIAPPKKEKLAESSRPKAVSYDYEAIRDGSALMQASERGDLEKVELLIEKGTDVNAKDNLRFTALMRAIERGHKEVAEVLIGKGADVNAISNLDDTALIIASDKGYKEIVELLIKSGADVNAKVRRRHPTTLIVAPTATALIIASDKGHKEIAELLIKGGADVNAKEKSSNTALMTAVERGNKEIVEVLIKNRADVNARGNLDRTALMFASKKGFKEIAELLIKSGADVNAQDINGATALWWALREGHKEIVVLLRQAGARE